MKMLGNRSGSGSFESSPDQEDDNPAPNRSSSAKNTGGFDDMDDDIPF
jgi:single-strand DNA-binding protein